MRHRRRLHRRERKLRNKKIIISMFALVLFLSCGYAAFSTSISLTAKGTIKEKYFTVNFKTQLLKNENFENGLDEWTFGGCSDNSSVTLDNDVTYNGYNTIKVHEDNTKLYCFSGIFQVVNRTYDSSKLYQISVNVYRNSFYDGLTNNFRIYLHMGKDGNKKSSYMIYKESGGIVIPINNSNLIDKTWQEFIGTGESIQSEVEINSLYGLYFNFNANSSAETPSTVWLASPRLYEIETKEIKGYKAIGTLPTATKEGYTFIGWYTEEYGGEKIDENTTIKEDTDFYAHFNTN